MRLLFAGTTSKPPFCVNVPTNEMNVSMNERFLWGLMRI